MTFACISLAFPAAGMAGDRVSSPVQIKLRSAMKEEGEIDIGSTSTRWPHGPSAGRRHEWVCSSVAVPCGH